MPKINDLDLKNWQQYDDIATDSLWLIDKRDNSGAHKGDYHGNFIPQIPNQMMRRYTKSGDWILDPFVGSGTTLIECKKLGRNGIGIDIDSNILSTAKTRANSEPGDSKCVFYHQDSSKINTNSILFQNHITSVQHVIYHPPYWDIIKFNDIPGNLSSATSLNEFLDMFLSVFDNTVKCLQDEHYFSIVIGDIYKGGEWIPLNSYIMQAIINKGYLLKSVIVKNISETKAKRNQKALWRYRALIGGFYVFNHEYILLFKKPKKLLVKN